MSLHTSGGLAAILAFNQAVLGQALALLDRHAERPDVDFSKVSGPHLRHVIEHYEALFTGAAAATISYDARQRDPQLERHVEVARARIRALLARFAQWTPAADAPVTTVLRCGLDGSAVIASASSMGRELMFVACHAIHHYALIQRLADAAGLMLPEGFGKAPSTVHHEASCALQVAA